MNSTHIEAAVLLPILAGSSSNSGFKLQTPEGSFTELSSTSTLLFTVRSQKVEHHKGQISFPGGVREPNDENLKYTALRETWEEIGLNPSHVEVIATLPLIPTVTSGFLVSPFVGLVANDAQFNPNADEIEEILHVPLGHLIDPGNHTIETYERAANDRGPSVIKLPVYHFEGHRIWGATAAMVANFLKLIRTY